MGQYNLSQHLSTVTPASTLSRFIGPIENCSDTVWGQLTDFGNWTTWSRQIQSVERLDAGSVGRGSLLKVHSGGSSQDWQITHQDSRLKASGTISLSGKAGDRFLLMKAPAVLTRFEGEGLRLTKRDVPGKGLLYIISIPVDVDAPAAAADAPVVDYQAKFEFQLEAIKPTESVPVLTGTAAVQEINLSYDESGWDVISPTAVRVESVEADAGTTFTIVVPATVPSVFQSSSPCVRSRATKIIVDSSCTNCPGDELSVSRFKSCGPLMSTKTGVAPW